jgi:hypothetical protein
MLKSNKQSISTVFLSPILLVSFISATLGIWSYCTHASSISSATIQFADDEITEDFSEIIRDSAVENT